MGAVATSAKILRAIVVQLTDVDTAQRESGARLLATIRDSWPKTGLLHVRVNSLPVDAADVHDIMCSVEEFLAPIFPVVEVIVNPVLGYVDVIRRG